MNEGQGAKAEASAKAQAWGDLRAVAFYKCRYCGAVYEVPAGEDPAAAAANAISGLDSELRVFAPHQCSADNRVVGIAELQGVRIPLDHEREMFGQRPLFPDHEEG